MRFDHEQKAALATSGIILLSALLLVAKVLWGG